MKFLIYLFIFCLPSIAVAKPTIVVSHADTHHHVQEAYVQTPLGGRPGSSDDKRPTFAELGIDHLFSRDQMIQLGWRNVGVIIGYQQLQSRGFTQLARDLITYKRKFFAGTPFNSDIQFDWYRFGLSYAIEFLKGFVVTPQADIVLLDFGYRFKTKAVSSGRHYHHMAFRTGFSLTVPLQQGVSLTFSLLASLYPFDILDITTRAITLNFKMDPRTQMSIGSQSTKINYEDKQTMPNHIHLNTGTGIIVKETRYANAND